MDHVRVRTLFLRDAEPRSSGPPPFGSNAADVVPVPRRYYSPGAMAIVERFSSIGKSAGEIAAAAAAPINWAITKAGTWLIAIPAKVVVKPRASVTAGLANDVDAVNQ